MKKIFRITIVGLLAMMLMVIYPIPVSATVELSASDQLSVVSGFVANAKLSTVDFVNWGDVFVVTQ
jgi:hypothetical protein